MKIEATDAFVVVDVQRDFCAGGALAVKDGDAVVPVINALTPKFKWRAFTRDWHPENHCSFAEHPQFVDKSWPKHCVQGTSGAELHPDLEVPADALMIDTADDPNKEAYSGFEGTDLAEQLRKRGIRRIFVGGIATDYCVKETALDGLKFGFEVYLVEDACRGVDVPPGFAAKAIEDMRTAGVTVCRSGDLL